MTWELLWKIVLIGVLGIFSVMAVLVTVFGARDIRELLRGLKEDERERESDSSGPES